MVRIKCTHCVFCNWLIISDLKIEVQISILIVVQVGLIHLISSIYVGGDLHKIHNFIHKIFLTNLHVNTHPRLTKYNVGQSVSIFFFSIVP